MLQVCYLLFYILYIIFYIVEKTLSIYHLKKFSAVSRRFLYSILHEPNPLWRGIIKFYEKKVLKLV